MSQSDSSSIAPAYILHAATVYTLFFPQFFSHLLSIDYRLFNVSLFIPLSLCRTADSNSHLSRPTQNPNSSVKDKRRSIAKRPSVAFYYAVIYFLLFCLCVCVCVCVYVCPRTSSSRQLAFSLPMKMKTRTLVPHFPRLLPPPSRHRLLPGDYLLIL